MYSRIRPRHQAATFGERSNLAARATRRDHVSPSRQKNRVKDDSLLPPRGFGNAQKKLPQQLERNGT
jgi:hypothetical protein